MPAGATCSLQGTQVPGDVIVRDGASLDGTGIVVAGNVRVERGAAVTLKDGRTAMRMEEG